MIELQILFLCLFIGAVVGMCAGMLGIGGGLIVVPALYYLLPQFGIESSVALHLALGTSMASIIVTAMSSVRSHHMLRNVVWSKVSVIAGGIAVGSLLGASVVDFLSEARLKQIFVVCVWGLASYLLFNRHKQSTRQLPSAGYLVLLGVATGILASLMGISGGLILIPTLHYFGMDMRRAIGSGAACGLVAAVAGTIGYIGVGFDHDYLPAYSVGYVYLPALLGIVATSVWFAPVGAKLAVKLPVVFLKKMFAIVLIVVGLNMVVS